MPAARSDVRDAPAAGVPVTGAAATDGPAPDATTRLYVALGRISRALRREGEADTVSPGVLSAMVTITKEGPLRCGEIAAREGVAAPSMTKIVSALEAQGYAERVVDPADARAALITATASGRALVESSREQRLHGMARRLAALDPAQRDRLTAALPALEALAAD